MKIAARIEERINQMEVGVTFKYNQLNIAANEYQAGTKTIERLIFKKTIKRLRKGVFYKPKKTVFGELLPRESEILKSYLFEKGNRIAYVTGTSLYNKMGITTQVPKTLRIASRRKRISVNIGTVQAKPVTSYVEVNNNNFKLLELLDVLKDFRKIPDKDEKMVIGYLFNRLKKLSTNDLALIVKCVLKYPPRCCAFLGALLDSIGYSGSLNVLRNNLNPVTIYQLGIDSKMLMTASDWNIE